jgi:hypothetical protein
MWQSQSREFHETKPKVTIQDIRRRNLPIQCSVMWIKCLLFESVSRFNILRTKNITPLLLANILSRVMLVTIDGVWIDNWIYWVPIQLHTITVDLYTRLHYTVVSDNGSSACVPLHCLLSAESLHSPGPRTSCGPTHYSLALTGHQLTLLFSTDDCWVSPLDWLTFGWVLTRLIWPGIGLQRKHPLLRQPIVACLAVTK